MKKILILGVILQGIIAVLPVSSQTTPNKGFSTADINNAKLRSMRARLSASLLASNIEEHATNAELALNTFNSKLDSIGGTSPLSPYKSLIDSTYLKLSKKTLINSEDAEPAIMPYKNGKLLLTHTLYHSTTYNEARLSQHEMVAKVVYDALLPIVYEVGGIKNVNIQYIGLEICYSHKDFTEKYAIFENWDYVLMIIPTSVLKDYANTYISDQDLVAKSDIYCGDDAITLRRVNITLK